MRAGMRDSEVWQSQYRLGGLEARMLRCDEDQRFVAVGVQFGCAAGQFKTTVQTRAVR
jgi:hypothetical protein